MKVKFYGALSEVFDDVELSGTNPQIIFSGLNHKYPSFKRMVTRFDAHYQIEDDVMHIAPRTCGSWAWVAPALQVIGALSAVYGAYVSIQQKRIQKQNKQAKGREVEGILFEGIINTDTQGGAIPLGFGEVYGGSVVINNELEPYNENEGA